MTRNVSWNVNHRAAQRKIPSEMADAIGSFKPDVVALTEYVPGSTLRTFIDGLSSVGLTYQQVTSFTPREIHILIVSKTPLEAGAIHTIQLHQIP